MRAPRLKVSGDLTHSRRFCGVLSIAPEANVTLLIRCAGNRVAVHAGLSLEDPLSCGNGGLLWARLLLVLDPGVKLFRGIDVYTEQHHGVLRATELSALAQVYAGHIGVEPHCVRMVGNQVGLAPSWGIQKL
jgi:hypothetical protein